MMKKTIIPLFMLVVSQLLPNAAASGTQAGFKNNWLMMVKTQNTDPSKDSEFNDWYNNVDIPDVLQVPGYMRARRGLGQILQGFPTPDLQDDKGKYIAFYNIDTANMDKTIIDMLMASWEMDKTGHSTNLLKVTERVYYHQYTPTVVAPAPRNAAANNYLYVVKINCCKTKSDLKKFDSWYNHDYVPGMMKTEGVMRATRYQLYRVLMTKPVEIPLFLAIFEINAASPEQALKNLHETVAKISEAGHMNKLYVEESAALYLTIKDVKRK
jgi:hypothetical protein